VAQKWEATFVEVRCYVESCAFWGNNLCQAEAIEVTSEDAEKAPQRSDHTMCETFRPRKS